MNHPVVIRQEWLKARQELLAAEKEHTRRSDALAVQRKALPWVRVDKEYSFDTPTGPAKLADLFRGRSQLLVYHFMFGPDYATGCPSCSSIADSFDGVRTHLANHDVMLWAVSRAPLEKLLAFHKRMGWSFPWASSFGSDFNADFNVSFTEDDQCTGIEYNYRREPAVPPQPKMPEQANNFTSQATPDGPQTGAAIAGTDLTTYVLERPGMSSFVLEDGQIYHTYSAFSRGLDVLWNMYQWLDRAPKGRNETGYWLKYHDSYGAASLPIASCCQTAKV